MSHILDNIYIGGYRDATNREFLRAHGIVYIVNCARELPAAPEYLPTRVCRQYLHLPMRDALNECLLKYLQRGVAFMHACAVRRVSAPGGKRAGILVHCSAGMSRSVSLVLAYLMLERGWTYASALRYVKSQRRIANPNPSFKLQLQYLQRVAQERASRTRDAHAAALRARYRNAHVRKPCALLGCASLGGG
jgi:protein-tyrosine phosphatase